MNNEIIMNKLEDLIDFPIKRTIALLNLIGFKTIWSCCGFNYPGEYGRDHSINRLSISFNGMDDVVDSNNYENIDYNVSLTTKFICEFNRHVSNYNVINEIETRISTNGYKINPEKVEWVICYNIPEQYINNLKMLSYVIQIIDDFIVKFGNEYNLFNTSEITLKDTFHDRCNDTDEYFYDLCQMNNRLGTPWTFHISDYLEKRNNEYILIK